METWEKLLKFCLTQSKQGVNPMKIKFPDVDSFLIWLYLTIDDMNKQTELPIYTERFSNNCLPYFTDSELFTCAIFTEILGYHSKKSGYDYIKRHYLNWFPLLPSYEVYSRKLNKFNEALSYIFKVICRRYFPNTTSEAVMDTAPIVVCKAQHSAKTKVGKPLVDKGYCASKKMYYAGVKLQILAGLQDKTLPFPFDYEIQSASVHDLDIAKQSLGDYQNFDIYCDKAYIDESFQLNLFENNNIKLITPIKKKKGAAELNLFQKCYNYLHSAKRQAIENLFGWIDKKTNIENANKVRSIDGLCYHVNVKMVAALLCLIVKF
jgi:hypothetical protein